MYEIKRKLVQCLHRVIKTPAEVWKNLTRNAMGKRADGRVFSQRFRFLPNFHVFLLNIDRAQTVGHAQCESRVHPPFHFQNGRRRIKNKHVIGKATEPLIFLLCFCGLVDNKCHLSRTCCGCFCSNRQNDAVKISY